MQANAPLDIARRFVLLPLAQRQVFLQKLQAKGKSLGQFPIPQTRGDFERIPASYAQQRQWFLWQLDPQASTYHIPVALRLHGTLDVAALQHSFDRLLERHEALRTVFRHEQGDTLQVLLANACLNITVEPMSALDEAQLRELIASEVARPFDLRQGPLLRVRLLRLGAAEHVLIMTQHHSVSDGWSMQVMVQELLALYCARCQGQTAPLPALPIQYADYALWQRAWMEAGEAERQLGYWLTQLAGEQPLLELPLDRPRPAQPSGHGASLPVSLPAALCTGLRQLAQQQGVTLFMLLLAAFQTLLQRYSGQTDIRVGVPVANRNRVETEGLIGFFVNTQVLKAQIDDQQPFTEVLAQVKQAVLGAQQHQDLPFERLVEALQPQRSLGHTPLFQVLFNHQTAAQRSAPTVELPGLRLEHLSQQGDRLAFDLTLNTFDSPAGIHATLGYATELFDAATITRFAGHWQQLLAAIVAAPQQRVGLLAILSPEEQQRTLGQCSRPLHEVVAQPVQQLFAAQVARSPQAPALLVDGQTLSYAELDQQANRLAHWLIDCGVGPDQLVAIAAERSLTLVVGMLATLKAGGAYQPLDPHAPRERLGFMIEDGGARVLLTQAHLQAQLPHCPGVTVLLPEQERARLADYPATCPQVAVQGEHLAYVIYTSGSTGQPKGVAVRHAGLSNHMAWMAAEFPLNSADRVLQKTPCSFDASVWEFWLPLLSGAQLVLAPANDPQGLGALWQWVEAQRISVLQLVPSLLQALLGAAEPHQLASLRLLFCGGEALSGRLAQSLAERWSGQLVNLYGPTEATIDSSCLKVLPAHYGQPTLALGQPIANVRFYPLSASLQPLPAGARGELHIAGHSLARGYHGRPGLTAERFVPDPFDPVGGGRLYRTGDLVCADPAGQVSYVGRIDHQVKIRGLRIELQEIEACLLDQPGVAEALVLACASAEGTQLVGYVVAAGAAQPGPLQQALKTRLPDYMVPAQIILLDAWPLTPSGKLDRRALPAPVPQQRPPRVPARNAAEHCLAAIWQQVLGLDEVGITDNFFELGGDSLQALRVVSLVEGQHAVALRVSLRDLMSRPTIAELCSDSTQPRSGDCLLALNREVPGSTPLFCLHMAYGTVFDYQALARRLDGQRTLYGLQSRLLFDPTWQADSLQAMAADYATRIRQCQPQGPYHLLGWSLGGALATLVAAELEGQGQRVEFLGLVDSYLPVPVAPPAANEAELQGFLQHLFGHVPAHLAASAFERSGALDLAALQATITALQAQGIATASDYARFPAAELAHLFSVGMTLRQLSGQLRELPSVHAPTHCWWAARSDLAASRAAFEQGLPHLASSTTLPLSHWQIVRSEELLDGLDR